MKRLAQILSCMALLLVIGQTAFGQGPLAEGFDTSKTVTLKGTMRGAWMVPDKPTLIMLEVPDKAGKPEMWIVAGKPGAVLQREGVLIVGPTPAVKGGDALTIDAYLQTPGSKAQTALAAALAGGPSGIVDQLAQNKARLARGVEITTADGKKLAFGVR